tara:strand:+ start:227 stop:370 length:144 start_codon:yes stop_codon:yes gene_type:complete
VEAKVALAYCLETLDQMLQLMVLVEVAAGVETTTAATDQQELFLSYQ